MKTFIRFTVVALTTMAASSLISAVSAQETGWWSCVTASEPDDIEYCEWQGGPGTTPAGYFEVTFSPPREKPKPVPTDGSVYVVPAGTKYWRLPITTWLEALPQIEDVKFRPDGTQWDDPLPAAAKKMNLAPAAALITIFIVIFTTLHLRRYLEDRRESGASLRRAA